jgi:hypothetical protein
MRNHVLSGITLGVCLVAALAFSCRKKGDGAAGEEALVIDIGPQTGSAVIISDNASQFIEEEPGIMTRKGSLRLGTALLVYYNIEGDSVVYEKKSAVRASDKVSRDFYHVLVDDIDYWIQEYALAPNAVPAVVVSKTALLYTKPELAAVSPNAVTLPEYAIVGLHRYPDTPDTFACVSGYINDKAVSEQYVKADTLTSDTTDVQVMLLYKIAAATPNEAVKKEILKNALNLGGVFFDMVNGTLNKIELGSFTRDTAPRVKSFEGQIISDDDSKVNVRDKPGITGTSTVLFTLLPGDEIEVIAVTNEQETISGIEDWWYKIITPDGKEGWVFGSYIRH